MLAVAGSGKTTYLVRKLDETQRVLIITYTIGNTRNLKNSIIEKFGYLPNNIKLKTYFSFLHSFCYKPFLADKVKSKGIYWKFPNEKTRNLERSNVAYYLLKGKWLYHNRIAKLLEEKQIILDINKRLEKYYDSIFVDEIQDFSGHDFNLIEGISKSKVNVLYVGDFFQHTFNTSSDGQTNKNLHKDFAKYSGRFKKMGLELDETTLKSSYRCPTPVCEFIKTELGIEIHSKSENKSIIKWISEESELKEIINNNKIVKLFYQKHYEYQCHSDNWGNCKGLEFENVCVVINDSTLKLFNKNKLRDLNEQTKNKFYVACSRTMNNLYFVSQKQLEKFKYIQKNNTKI